MSELLPRGSVIVDEFAAGSSCSAINCVGLAPSPSIAQVALVGRLPGRWLWWPYWTSHATRRVGSLV